MSEFSSSDESSIVGAGDGGSESLDSTMVGVGEIIRCTSGRSRRF